MFNFLHLLFSFERLHVMIGMLCVNILNISKCSRTECSDAFNGPVTPYLILPIYNVYLALHVGQWDLFELDNQT